MLKTVAARVASDEDADAIAITSARSMPLRSGLSGTMITQPGSTFALKLLTEVDLPFWYTMVTLFRLARKP